MWRHFEPFEIANGRVRYKAEPWTEADLELSATQLAKWLDQRIQHDASADWIESSQCRPDVLYRSIEGDDEVRVLELQPGTYADDLSATLKHVSVGFEHTPDAAGRKMHCLHAVDLEKRAPVWYTALSYRWGPPHFTSKMSCNGHSKGITPSLEVALRHLRHPEHPVILWVDQLCIDQSNDIEKSHQVSLMSLVYKRALNTVIWLGEEPENGAFAALKGLHEALQYRNEELTKEELEYLRRPLNEEPVVYETLETILSHPWFTRVWIIQEAVLSHYVYAMRGSATMAWEDFASHCNTVRETRPFDESPGKSNTHPQYQRPAAAGCEASAKIYLLGVTVAQFTYVTLLTALTDTRDATSWDPRDKVFGVLGLCQSSIKPDYARSARDVYIEATIECFREQGPDKSTLRFPVGDVFRVLSCVDHDNSTGQLPSWVPDWSQKRHTSSLGFRAWSADCYNVGGNVLQKAVRAKETVTFEDGVLHISRARMFDHIAALTDVLHGDIPSSADTTQQSQELKTCVEFASQLSASTPETEAYDIFVAFLHTLVAGKDGSGTAKSPNTYTEIISFLIDHVTGHTLSQPSLAGQTYTTRQLKGRFAFSHLHTRSTARVFQDLRKACRAALRNRKMFITKRGLLGLVPNYAQAGDEVAVIIGAAVPFVFRPHEDGTYTLIGECYVYGAMNGEVAHMDGVREMSMEVV